MREINKEDEFEMAANIKGWKAPVPDGVELTHINNSHLDSYFK